MEKKKPARSNALPSDSFSYHIKIMSMRTQFFPKGETFVLTFVRETKLAKERDSSKKNSSKNREIEWIFSSLKPTLEGLVLKALLVLCFFDRLNSLLRYPKPYSTLVAYLDLFNLELVLCFGGILFERPATLNLNKDISLYTL